MFEEDGEEREFTLMVNGSEVQIRATPDMPLLWALRQEAGLSGVKFGCGAGLCGACTVHLNGNSLRSCQVGIGDIGDAVLDRDAARSAGRHEVRHFSRVRWSADIDDPETVFVVGDDRVVATDRDAADRPWQGDLADLLWERGVRNIGDSQDRSGSVERQVPRDGHG